MRRKSIFLAGLAAAVTFLVYLPALRSGFVNWDDNLYVYENLSIRNIDRHFFREAFLRFHESGNWHPLTLLSHALDYAVWGLNPLGHHLTSVLLHTINTFLVVYLVVELLESANTTPQPPSPGAEERGGQRQARAILTAGAVTGLLFGIHPLHVESVAWVSERKDVLYAFFFLLGIVSYLRYCGGTGPEPRARWYAVTLLLFVLSLMSKPMAVTFPVVLLILDWYPLGRLGASPVRSVLYEKVPFAVLSIAASFVTLLAQKAGGAIAPFEMIPLSQRIPVAVRSFVMYLYRIAVPVRLLPMYAYPRDASLLSAQYLFPALVLATLTVLLLMRRSGWRLWTAVAMYYTATIFPVLGIIQVGSQSMADRYVYLPILGPLLLAGIGAGIFLDGAAAQKRRSKVFWASSILCMAVVAALSVLTVKQTGIWQNELTLWNHELRFDPLNHSAFNSRGYYYYRTGRYDEALKDYASAISLSPRPVAAYFNNRAHAMAAEGHFEGALREMTKAVNLATDKDSYRYLNDRAIILVNLGRYPEALSDYNRALLMNPSFAEAYYNRGNAFAYLGRNEEAVRDYSRAIQVTAFPSPDYYHNRAIVQRRLGNLPGAADDARRADELRRDRDGNR